MRDYSKMSEIDCNQIMTHYGKSNVQFNNLRDVAIGPNKEIIIVDNGNHCVLVLDHKLNLLTVIGNFKTNKKFVSRTLTDPCCVAFCEGIVAISDQKGSHQIKKYTLEGIFKSAIGRFGTQTGEFDYPRGLAFNNNKKLYVVDGFNHRIQVFQQDGKFSFSFGRKGAGPGEFDFPVRIACDSESRVLVSDYGNNRISQFSCNGEFIGVIICTKPWAITVTPDEYLITSHDRANKVICIWDSCYQLINEFGTKENFNEIRGIKIDSSGSIFMVDHEVNEMKIFYNN